MHQQGVVQIKEKHKSGMFNIGDAIDAYQTQKAKISITIILICYFIGIFHQQSVVDYNCIKIDRDQGETCQDW